MSKKSDYIETIQKIVRKRGRNGSASGQRRIPDTTIIQEPAKCKQKIPRTGRFDHTGTHEIEPNHNILWYIRNTGKTTKK